MLNSILWDQNFSKENKKRIYNSIIKSIVTYGSEVWQIKEKTEKMITATEMDFWSLAGRIRRERVTNEKIREIMDVKHSLVDDIKTKQLIWYGHVQRMSQERLPKQILEWSPRERRKRERPRKSWRKGINKEMERRELTDNMWAGRDGWRLGVGRQRRML